MTGRLFSVPLLTRQPVCLPSGSLALRWHVAAGRACPAVGDTGALGGVRLPQACQRLPFPVPRALLETFAPVVPCVLAGSLPSGDGTQAPLLAAGLQLAPSSVRVSFLVVSLIWESGGLASERMELP